MTVLESVKKTNRLVIIEEQWPFASVSSELSYRIQKEGFDYLDAPIRRITSADAPMHYAPNLTALAIPDVTRSVKLVERSLTTIQVRPKSLYLTIYTMALRLINNLYNIPYKGIFLYYITLQLWA